MDRTGFDFKVNDGTVDSTSDGTVSITVTPVNDPPVADDQPGVSTPEETAKVITLTGSDIDGDSLTFSITSGPTHGTLGSITQVTPTSATVEYTPDPDYNGPDSFDFKVNDGTETAPVTVLYL